ncbi:MAG: hypothetical protein JXJ17_12475 [Anaerolineae bacterium]|nr:hypothetical protein [Anaerolineae bacterium]
MIQEIVVDLTQPPSKRWKLTDMQIEQAQLLLDSYLQDLGGLDDFADLLSGYAESFVESAYMAEILSIADQIGATTDEALLVNLYYDAIKFVFGCTAFGVDTPGGPLHARNLDWWTKNDMLSQYTLLTHFVGGQYGNFTTVGWPGFVGALSGVAHGRFSVTLNAVLSEESPALATPISLFLRTVFEQAATYKEALTMLAKQSIACDCLLLITGTQSGEMAVVERTPTRSAVRNEEEGFVIVTNNYRTMESNTSSSAGELQETSCGRYQRTAEHLLDHLPSTDAECLAILRDPGIQMDITVQQMVFSSQTGSSRIENAS